MLNLTEFEQKQLENIFPNGVPVHGGKGHMVYLDLGKVLERTEEEDRVEDVIEYFDAPDEWNLDIYKTVLAAAERLVYDPTSDLYDPSVDDEMTAAEKEALEEEVDIPF